MDKQKRFLKIDKRLISARLEPVLSYTEKSCIALYYRQFSTNIKVKIIILIPVLVNPDLRPKGGNKTSFNLKNFHINIRGKLSTILCDL